MRKWRVGTLSMGLLLVLTGIGLLLGQFNQLAVVDISLKWWPLLFVMLGIEVLLQNQMKKDEDSKIKYDVFSIIIILFIVLTGLGLQTFSQLGLVELARTEISSHGFAIQGSSEIPLEAGVQKIILTTGNNPVNIHSSQGNSIIANSDLLVRAQSKLEAQETAGLYNGLSQRRVADVLYVGLPTNHGSSPVMNGSYTLIIPEYISVEIDDADNSLNINLDSIQNDWEINGSGSCTIQLPGSADLTVNTWMRNGKAIQGNLAWSKTKFGVEANKPADNNESREILIQAQAKLGNGSHQMNLLGMNELTINSLP